MARALTLALPLAFAPALLACDPGTFVERRGHRTIREVEAGEARRRVAERGAALVQVRGRREASPRIARAIALEPGDPLPSGVTGGIVVLAADPAAGRRLAARFARAGIEEVALVRGGLSAWQIEAARAAKTPTPDAAAAAARGRPTAGEIPQGARRDGRAG